ncbi:hypothetical protein B0H66DRAFT_631357 [Apodospora peruviana]|uniref:Serine protease n=1 Tax=Apodospora peruviana TaxID=516989 RepID=A0AAE0LYU1_9PEZI|nr:hypothetical protein B0H66DRAFT_631357 [Apodospora peruviana]
MTSADEVLSASGVIGATWKVGAQTPQLGASGSSESLFSLMTLLIGPFTEDVILPDNRIPVDPSDYADGGKYRAIVKLIIRYEGMGPEDKRYAIGTGYLISPDTLITAGHCVFDLNHETKKGLGRVSEMKAYIGYHGRDFVGQDKSVQERFAVQAGTTLRWVKGAERQGDVGFVKLDRPFEGNLRPFKFKDTPTKRTNVMLDIAGFPGDKIVADEPGARMYELMQSSSFDLDKNEFNMISYKISTFKGQSGAPVIQRDEEGAVVIGTHCYGGSDVNSASVIGGKYGVNYNAFLEALTGTTNPAIPSITSLPISTLLNKQEAEMLSDSRNTEDFFSVLKDIGRVVAPIAQTALAVGSPLLGPLGAPISCIGGMALSALNKAVTESGLIGDTPPSSATKAAVVPTKPISLERGTAQRAILAESALQTVLRMERSPASEKILGSIQKKYTECGFNASQADKLGRQMVPLLSQAGLRFAINEGLVKKDTSWHPTATSLRKEGEADVVTGDERVDGLINSISTVPVKKLDNSPETESLLQDITGFLSSALTVAKPVLLTSARAGLKKIDEMLAKKGGNTEAGLVDDSTPGVVSDEKAAAWLAHRAVVAECALQAVVEADKKALQESVILGGVDGVQQESFLGGLMKAVQVIAPAVIKVAPAVLKTAVPTLLNAVAGESAVVSPQQVSKFLRVRGNEGADDRMFVMAEDIEIGQENGGPKGPKPKEPEPKGSKPDILFIDRGNGSSLNNP